MIERIKRPYRKIRSKAGGLRNKWFGHRNYKKFVIISRSRTGSTLLMALLRSHPNIHIQGEMFKKLKGRTCQQIWDDLFNKKPRKIKYAGFKLFYYHPFDQDKQVWDFITDDPTITIFHLRRENLLRAYASQKIGEKTRQWTQHVSDATKFDKTIELNPEECLETFETIKGYEDDTRERFGARDNYIECTYEEMTTDTQKFIASIYEKLQLKPHTASTVLKKQNPETLQNLIVNYDNLKARFASTQWAYLFNDSSIS